MYVTCILQLGVLWIHKANIYSLESAFNSFEKPLHFENSSGILMKSSFMVFQRFKIVLYIEQVKPPFEVPEKHFFLECSLNIGANFTARIRVSFFFQNGFHVSYHTGVCFMAKDDNYSSVAPFRNLASELNGNTLLDTIPICERFYLEPFAVKYSQHRTQSLTKLTNKLIV